MKDPTTELLHRRDPALLAFEARVVGLRAWERGVEVALDRTAFYAESGGQPDDAGFLAGRPVVALVAERGIVWHRLEGPADLAIDATVPGVVDGERRQDLMQQHTGQHILSQAFFRTGSRGTVSVHFGAAESTIDLDGARPDPPLLEEVSVRANACVLSDREVRTHVVPRAELGRYPLRREPGIDEDPLRLVEIEEWDWSACGGTHARRTGEVGPLLLLGVEKIRDHWRVRYLAGRRALAWMRSAHQVLDETARDQTIDWRRLPEAVRGWRAEAVEAMREGRRLRVALAAREAERLAAEVVVGSDGIRWLSLWLGERSAEETRELAVRFADAAEPAVILAGGRTAGRSAWTAARSDALPGRWSRLSAAELLRAWLATMGGKGGGTERCAQGGAPLPDGQDEAALQASLAAWLQNRIENGLGAGD